MSVVRLLSTVFAMIVTFLWAGYVVNAWQKNSVARQLAQTNVNQEKSTDKSIAKTASIIDDKKGEAKDIAKTQAEVASKVVQAKKIDQAKIDPTLDKADELARAANEEFSKRIKLADAKILKSSTPKDTKKDTKKVVEEKKKPSDEIKVAEVSSDSLKTVTEKTKYVSYNQESVVSKDGTVTDLTQKAVVQKAVVERKVEEIVTDKDQTRISSEKETARISDDENRDRYAPIELAKERIAIASTKKEVMTDVVDERALLKEDRIESKVETRLSFDTTSDEDGSDIDHNVARGGKDNSRLSKDLVAVAVNKHQPKEIKVAENTALKKSPEKVLKKSETKKAAGDKKAEDKALKAKSQEKDKEVAKAKPIWTVPTGVTPEYSVVEQIERGLDSVADAAVKAGNKITEKVTSIGDNVKGAIAAPKKWEVPTGVTPGEEGDGKASSIKVAETPKLKKSAEKVKDTSKAKKVRDDTISKVAVVAPKSVKKKSSDKKVASKKEDETSIEANKVYVSSQLDYSGAQIYDEDGKLVVAEVKKEEKPKTGGLVKTIINLLTDPDKEVTAKKEEQKETQVVSRVDKVRFQALKSLMVEDVDYKFINAKKGQGQIVVIGRSQADAKLSLYVGVRYLGDVIADNSGNWIFTKELYIPQGGHILQAQQMSDSGIAMARKTLPFKQIKKGRPPKGYDKNGIGIELGDKALATLRTKLNKDKEAGKNGKKLTKAEARRLKRNKALAARTPLPVRKTGEKKLASLSKAKEIKVAVLDKKAGVSKTAKKEKAAQDVKPSAKGKIKAVSKDELAKKPVKSADKPVARYYIVKAGDSLGRIAKRELGKTSAYKTILKLNKKLKSANLIYPGQKLLISAGGGEVASKPEEKDVKVKKKQVASLALPKIKTKKEVTPVKKTDEADKPSHYVVKRGDSLWKIAAKVYGNGRRYKELIKLNPKILKNPAAIKPNLKLRVKSS